MKIWPHDYCRIDFLNTIKSWVFLIYKSYWDVYVHAVVAQWSTMTHCSAFVYFRMFYIAWWVKCDSGLTCFEKWGCWYCREFFFNGCYLELSRFCLILCSCSRRVFSSLTGLGMKPTSQPSFTRRPIHQSLLYFWIHNRTSQTSAHQHTPAFSCSYTSPFSRQLVPLSIKTHKNNTLQLLIGTFYIIKAFII